MSVGNAGLARTSTEGAGAGFKDCLAAVGTKASLERDCEAFEDLPRRWGAGDGPGLSSTSNESQCTCACVCARNRHRLNGERGCSSCCHFSEANDHFKRNHA